MAAVVMVDGVVVVVRAAVALVVAVVAVATRAAGMPRADGLAAIATRLRQWPRLPRHPRAERPRPNK